MCKWENNSLRLPETIHLVLLTFSANNFTHGVCFQNETEEESIDLSTVFRICLPAGFTRLSIFLWMCM